MTASRVLPRRLATVAATVLATAGIGLAAPAAQADAALSQLSITVTEVLGGSVQNYYLTCDPDGTAEIGSPGVHPDPVGACNRLRALHGDVDALKFRPAPCAKEFDPYKVAIIGHWRDKEVKFVETYPNLDCLAVLTSPVVPIPNGNAAHGSPKTVK
ncbi:SSI family serine proteinase inhibitor [Streptomyces sp. NPDC002054]|uniref:SSI family serine proteinase inhibitor n=1 Tax=Streptomyces sp. NPDC002054 TaxID=3154663 RepID=UPI00332474DE